MYTGKLSLFIFIFASLNWAQAFEFGKEKYELNPSVGLGMNSLNMNVNSDSRFAATNTNFYFVNLGLGLFSVQAKFPQLDPAESRQSRVDSKIQDYQLSLDVYKNWKAAFYYQDYKGYYVENPNVTGVFKRPDLNSSHIGTQVFYMFNPDHASFLIQDTYWNQLEDSASFLVSVGLDQFTFTGDLLPDQLKFNKDQILKKAKIDALTIRVGGSKNWVWSHWFVGTAVGIGNTFTSVDATYEKAYQPVADPSQKSATHINSIFAFSSGYRWITSKVGVFARASTWNFNFDEISISSNTSSTGFYYSTVF